MIDGFLLLTFVQRSQAAASLAISPSLAAFEGIDARILTTGNWIPNSREFLLNSTAQKSLSAGAVQLVARSNCRYLLYVQ